MDAEKISAFQGFAMLLQSNPKAAVTSGVSTLSLVFEAVSTLFPPVPQLQQTFSKILGDYKNEMGNDWPQMWATFDSNMKYAFYF